MSIANPSLLPTVKEIENKYRTKIEVMGKFLAGDDRVNEMPGLTVMHLLWVREHNRIANLIVVEQPNWSDELVYQEAR